MSRYLALAVVVIALVCVAPIAVAFNTPIPALASGAVVACGTSPTIVNPGGTSATRSFCVQNINAVAIYVGGPDVTTTNGHVVPAGSLADPKSICFDAHHGWCTVAAATADARIVYGIGQ